MLEWPKSVFTLNYKCRRLTSVNLWVSIFIAEDSARGGADALYLEGWYNKRYQGQLALKPFPEHTQVNIIPRYVGSALKSEK